MLQQGGAQQVQVDQGGQVVIQEERFVHQQEGDEVRRPATDAHTAQTHEPSPHTWNTHTDECTDLCLFRLHDVIRTWTSVCTVR